MIDVLRFGIFNRQTKEKLEESLFAVIHKEWTANISATYVISLESHGGDVHNLLLLFAAGNYTVSNIIEDHVGLLVSGEPDLVFILQFSPFEHDAAVAFRAEAFRQRSRTLDYLSNDELVGKRMRLICADVSVHAMCHPTVLKAVFQHVFPQRTFID